MTIVACSCGVQSVVDADVFFAQSAFPQLNGKGNVTIEFRGSNGEDGTVNMGAQCFGPNPDDVENRMGFSFNGCVNDAHVTARLFAATQCPPTSPGETSPDPNTQELGSAIAAVQLTCDELQPLTDHTKLVRIQILPTGG